VKEVRELKKAVVGFVFTFVIAGMTPASATDLRLWPGKQLPAGEQKFCINVVAEQQYHGGGGDALYIRFDTSVEGSVSLDGGTISEFKYEKGQVSETEVHFGRNDFAAGKVVQIGIRVAAPTTVVKEGLHLYTINTTRIVQCPGAR
jgi:hypothetical protein